MVSLGFSVQSFTINYFKLLLFQTNFHLPCGFEIAGFNCYSYCFVFLITDCEKYQPQTILPKQVDCFFEMHNAAAIGEKGECFGSHGKARMSRFLHAV